MIVEIQGLIACAIYDNLFDSNVFQTAVRPFSSVKNSSLLFNSTCEWSLLHKINKRKVILIEEWTCQRNDCLVSPQAQLLFKTGKLLRNKPIPTIYFCNQLPTA